MIKPSDSKLSQVRLSEFSIGSTCFRNRQAGNTGDWSTAPGRLGRECPVGGLGLQGRNIHEAVPMGIPANCAKAGTWMFRSHIWCSLNRFDRTRNGIVHALG